MSKQNNRKFEQLNFWTAPSMQGVNTLDSINIMQFRHF